MDADRVSDEEVVYRRVPSTLPWLEPPDRVTTANFKLDQRRSEQGLSVYRQAVVTIDDVLAKPDAIPGSHVARATVGAIRALCNGRQEPLNLDVIIVAAENNPGHAEIRGPQPGKLSQAASNALRNLFQLV